MLKTPRPNTELSRVKGKVYKVAVRPTMLYGLETVALTKRQEADMEVAELKMLRFSLGVTRMDKIRNEWYPDRIPQDKIPQDKIPTDKIPQDRIPQDKIPQPEKWTKSHNMKS